MHQSIVQQRGHVLFPEFTGERVYMHGFHQSKGLPSHLARWQATVDMMLDGVKVDGPIYLMVDQGIVKAGNPHRRPGVHIDGYWVPGIQAHAASDIEETGRHRSSSHRPEPVDTHRPTPRHTASASDWDTNNWSTADFKEHEGLILASTVTAARAFEGVWEGNPTDGGDCTHIDVSGMRPILLQAGSAYAGNVTMLHESIPVPMDCQRTVVRLNIPGWTPQ